MTNMKDNKDNDPPYPDGPLRDYHKAEYKSKKRLIKRLEYSEGRLRNIETFLDGMTRLSKGKFRKIDLEYIDEE